MKQLFLLLGCILFQQIAHANLIRVNNNFGITASYSNAQAAHNAASSGDTIYLEPSPNSYGTITCTKQLVWIGVGYFLNPLNTNNNLGLQFHTNSSLVDYILCNAGSANSVYMGLQTYVAFISTNNITISRCLINGDIAFYATTSNLTSNFTLSQSFLLGSIVPYSYNPGTANSSGYALMNNVILGALQLPANYLGVIVNNNFINQMNMVAFVVSNNIINASTSSPSVICTYASNVYNNLFTTFSVGSYAGNNGNLFSASNPNNSSNSIFVGAISTSYDSWTTLKAGSPAIGNGLNGIDIGPRGGTSPYKLSGIPNIPSISQFQFRSTPSNTLPITISTRSNN